jgi:hypothetical protein
MGIDGRGREEGMAEVRTAFSLSVERRGKKVTLGVRKKKISKMGAERKLRN